MKTLTVSRAVIALGMVACCGLANPFSDSVEGVRADLDASLRELGELREKIQAEQVPMTQELSRIEEELIVARKEYDRVLKIRDSRTLDVSNLKSEIKAREDQNKYLSNLIDEYLRNLETRLHISEVQRYAKALEETRLVAENNDFTLGQKFEARLKSVELSLDRIEGLMGGEIRPGTAVNASGLVVAGKFLQLGSLTFFAGDDGKTSGLVEQQLGKSEPVVVPMDPAFETMLVQAIARGEGKAPVDPTGGNARKVEATKETLIEHIKKGGLTMVPMLTLAGVAMIIGLIKWIQMSRVRSATPREVEMILDYLNAGKVADARQTAAKINGPVGAMLCEAIDHIREPKELIEELLFEKTLYAKTKLNSMLPFIAVTASSAPLLGLLGTVTGMINTFKMITVFGTGDAQTLSGGISEALITTEWGLIVAIPAVLLYAFLSRKAKGLLDDMEKIAVSFLNRLSAKSGERREPESPEGSESTREREMMGGTLLESGAV
jgi:biopolymer transport protein ExbB